MKISWDSLFSPKVSSLTFVLVPMKKNGIKSHNYNLFEALYFGNSCVILTETGGCGARRFFLPECRAIDVRSGLPT